MKNFLDNFFTPQERSVVMFLVVCIIVGIGIYVYKLKTPVFAPELKSSYLKSVVFTDSVVVKNAQFTGVVNESKPKAVSPTKPKAVTPTESKPLNLPEQKQTYDEAKKININTASIEELISLPGVGPVYAQRIVDYREKKGKFKSIEEIINIYGIGQKRFDKLKDKITVE
ncbi:MAG: helix-hairpin-helix domain-containing protein [bacterium]|nr:helix-hairpin-helix domain-containing protein [bacterium]